jgi:polyhydroxyalkanoate synthesis repressor PhaR
MPDTKIIKKHANRRLYDTQARRNVTLSDIRQMITSGVDLQVIDGASNDDITRATLLQIIVEREMSGKPVLSEPVLVQLIQFYDNPMQEMMRDFLQRSVSTFISQQQNYQSQLQQLLSTSPIEVVHEMMLQNIKNWEAASDMFTNTSDEDSESKHNDKDA